MNKITLNNFQAVGNCRCNWYTSRESFFKITCNIHTGNVCGLVSNFGLGSWGFASSICGRGELYDGEMIVDDLKVEPTYFYDKTIFVFDETNNESIKECKNMSVKEHIEKALAISKIPYNHNDIKSMFCLTDERYHRPLGQVGIEIWRITIAIGFSLNKQIFCFPWLNERDIVFLQQKQVLDYLKCNGKIVLIPTSEYKTVKKYSDYIIDFRNKNKSCSKPVKYHGFKR